MALAAGAFLTSGGVMDGALMHTAAKHVDRNGDDESGHRSASRLLVWFCSAERRSGYATMIPTTNAAPRITAVRFPMFIHPICYNGCVFIEVARRSVGMPGAISTRIWVALMAPSTP
jgi:hypothetical protein